MDHKRLFMLVASVLMVLLVPVIISLYNFNSVVFDKNLYKKEFLRYNVYMHLDKYDIENVNSDVLTYLKNKKNNALTENGFFNEREKTHLLDVKNLIGAILAMYHISIILFFLLFIALIFLLNFNFKKIAKISSVILFLGSILTLLVAVLFFVLSKFNFDFVFDALHNTFFSFGTYTFNPEFEKIVVLYPQNLFFDLLVRIVTNTILSSIILLFLCNAYFFIFFRSNPKKFF